MDKAPAQQAEWVGGHSKSSCAGPSQDHAPSGFHTRKDKHRECIFLQTPKLISDTVIGKAGNA
ncbi:hypothetical protein [Paracoccus lichenicola]|uniref:hypothetical protein n=1 Tax=Paracoccus lichenicola TaxID=2665644 RepID=UPI0018A9E906|nr:hypothetical protein [Paracoccus lichenicola]